MTWQPELMFGAEQETHRRPTQAGRIFACARQSADGADGQGDQHDIGRGANADCVPGGGREAGV